MKPKIMCNKKVLVSKAISTKRKHGGYKQGIYLMFTKDILQNIAQ